MQVSISSGVWAEPLHALQNAPPNRGGMLNDLSDGRIKQIKHFLKIRFDLSMVYLKEFVYVHVLKLHLCIYHAQNFLNITPLYMVTDFKSCIYGFFSFTHDIL